MYEYCVWIEAGKTCANLRKLGYQVKPYFMRTVVFVATKSPAARR
jgi:hypothetical protein